MIGYLANLMNMNVADPKALEMALSQPVSLVLAGPNSGSLELIRAIYDAAGDDTAICAPTGYRAMKLSQKLGCTAYPTVSAPILGSGQIVITEAQMLSRMDFNRVLYFMRVGARLTLIGDDRQLCSDVFSEFIASEAPVYRLRSNPNGSALRYNLANFPVMHSIDDLHFDESFQLIELPDAEVKRRIVDDAVSRWWHESVRVISAHDSGTALSAGALHSAIRTRIDPFTDDTVYACAPQSAQGCQYGTVLLPVSMSTGFDRTSLYTALCCAACRVVIYGSRQALNAVMQRSAPKEVV